MTVVALGGGVFLLVAILACCTMSGIFIDGDLGRCPLMTGGALHLLTMRLMIEGDRPFLVFISYRVSSVGQGERKGNQHYSNNQFLHVSLLRGVLVTHVCW